MADSVLPWPQNAAAGVRGFLNEIRSAGKPVEDGENVRPGLVAAQIDAIISADELSVRLPAPGADGALTGSRQ